MSRTKERRRAHRLARRVIAFLREGDEEWLVALVKLEGELKKRLGHEKIDILCGVCDPEDSILYIDDRHAGVIDTIVHEVFRVLYPDRPHKEIYAMEGLVMRHITRNQREAIWFWAGFRMRGARRSMPAKD